MGLVTRVQIIDKTVCVSFCANTLEKGMNLNDISPAMDK